MKRVHLLFVISVLAAAVFLFLYSARSERKKREDILEKFEEIDAQLNSTNDSLDSEKGIGAIQGNLSIVLMNNEIILLIDSLREKFESKPGETSLSQLKPDIMRLLVYIQEANKLKRDMVDSRIPDTIKYWTSTADFNQEKWYSMYFKQSNEVAITYLNYQKNEAIANNY